MQARIKTQEISTESLLVQKKREEEEANLILSK